MPSPEPNAVPSFVTIFDDTYDQPDCRAYYRMLRALHYSNHTNAVPVFRAVLAELAKVRGLEAPRVFDFASSYGIVSALMKHQISADAFLDRYASPTLDDLTAEEMRDTDSGWLAELPLNALRPSFVGIDVAGNAIRYAKGIGLFEQGFSEDIQTAPASPALAASLAQTDLIVECGSVAHLMPAALDRMLSAATRKPWLVTSPVRGNERSQAFDVMQDHGLVVETLGLPPFPHRRFENRDEQARAIAIARAAGHETDGFETTGAFFAQIYIARPSDETTPITDWPVNPADLIGG